MSEPVKVAKLIKKELTTKWKGFKFSVTCGRGSVWGTIYVNWVRDAIKREDVEALIGKYQTYSGWDPHTDYNYHDNRRTDIPQVSQIWFNHSPI